MLHLFAQTVDLEQQIIRLGTSTVTIAAFILIVCTIVAALLKDRHKELRLPLFVIMAATLVVSTATLFGSTIYLNTRAESGGPVHWHTDIEFWACGTELNLRDPTGALSNKIGSATYHEHNDKRIHLEGVVVKKSEDAGIKKFMDLTGGKISHDQLTVPLNTDQSTWFANEGDQLDGDEHHPENHSLAIGNTNRVSQDEKGALLTFRSGEYCTGPQENAATVQTFVYTFNEQDKTYSQRKLEDPAEYIMRDESTVPPGDCVIVEFDQPKDRTDKLCRQYGVRDEKRCTQFGVKSYTPELCNVREVSTNSGGHN